MRFTAKILVVLLALAVTPVPVAEAQPGRDTMSWKATQAVLQQYDRRLKAVDELLVDGDPEKAYKKVSALLREMTHRFVAGSVVGRFLGLATTLRAIAAYQLGRHDEAIWHWQVAVQMFPEVADYKMTAYGDAGPFLKSHSLQEARSSQDPKVAHLALDSAITPPEKRRAPQPEFPMAKRRGADDVAVVVSVIIGKDGRVRHPWVMSSQGELTLVCATLDTLRSWDFEPAKLDGEPVAVFYNLTVNFKSMGR